MGDREISDDGVRAYLVERWTGADIDRVGYVLSRIDLPQFDLKAVIEGVDKSINGTLYADSVCVRIDDPYGTCNITGEPMPWKGRKWRLSKHMTDGEIVQTVWAAYMMAVEHEAREGFLYKGQAVFDPHYDIDKLVELRASAGAIKGRPEVQA